MVASDLFTNLNRIGIILNFAAGFLLAPELIGLERIKRIQSRITDSLFLARRLLRILGHKGEIREKLVTWILIFFVVFYTLGYLLYEYGWHKTGFSLFLLLGLQAWITIVSVYQARTQFEVDRSKPKVFLSIFLSFIPVILLSTLFFFFYWVSLLVLHKGIEIVINRLAHGAQLQGFIVSLGVFFFILGNLLQLIATF